MIDKRQIYISLEVGTSTKIVRRGWQKLDGIRRQNSVEKQGIWGTTVNCPTEPNDQ